MANTNDDKQNKDPNASAQSKARKISMEEVKKHDTEEDAWIVVNGKVYDVTKFLDDHPGGPEVVTENAGTEATDAYVFFVCSRQLLSFFFRVLSR